MPTSDELRNFIKDLAPITPPPVRDNFSIRGVDFITSNLRSLLNNDMAGNSLDDISLLFYNDAGEEIRTQPQLDTTCTKTKLKINIPDNLLSIKLIPKAEPTQDIILYCYYDRTRNNKKTVLVNQLNLNYLKRKESFLIKPTQTTNTLIKEFNHPAGYQLEFSLIIEYFK